MDQANLGSIVEQLKHQQAALEAEKKSLNEELANVESGLTRIEDAIAALHPNGKAKPKQAKPCANRDAVRDAVRACIAEDRSLDSESIKSAVGKRVMAAGFSRSGLALRLKEVLCEEEFVQSVAGHNAGEEGSGTNV